MAGGPRRRRRRKWRSSSARPRLEGRDRPATRKPYAFEIPPALAAQAAASVDSVTVRLISTTWNPRALTGADDNRDLGVMVDRVEVRRVGAAR